MQHPAAAPLRDGVDLAWPGAATAVDAKPRHDANFAAAAVARQLVAAADTQSASGGAKLSLCASTCKSDVTIDVCRQRAAMWAVLTPAHYAHLSVGSPAHLDLLWCADMLATAMGQAACNAVMSQLTSSGEVLRFDGCQSAALGVTLVSFQNQCVIMPHCTLRPTHATSWRQMSMAEAHFLAEKRHRLSSERPRQFCWQRCRVFTRTTAW